MIISAVDRILTYPVVTASFSDGRLVRHPPSEHQQHPLLILLPCRTLLTLAYYQGSRGNALPKVVGSHNSIRNAVTRDFAVCIVSGWVVAL